MFIDATANGGVGVCSWKDFVGKEYYKGYSHIVHRPLHFSRSFSNLSKLEQFLKVAFSSSLEADRKKVPTESAAHPAEVLGTRLSGRRGEKGQGLLLLRAGGGDLQAAGHPAKPNQLSAVLARVLFRRNPAQSGRWRRVRTRVFNIFQ